MRSGHPFAVAIVLVVAALVGALAIGAIWANRQLLDTRSWVATSSRMLGNAEVRHRVAAFLADELTTETEAQLAAAGREEVAGDVLPQLRREAPGLAARALDSPRFRVVWRRANRIGQRTLVRVLDEDEPAAASGGLVVDLTPALRELARSLDGTPLASGLGMDLGSFVEPGAARIKVLEADELDRAQDAAWAIRHLPAPATIATLVLFALALALGRAQLRRTAGTVGLSLLAAGGIALVVRAIAGHEIVDRLLEGDADREAAEAAWGIATSTVADLAGAAIGLGSLFVLWAVLLGESAPALRFRHALAPLVATPLGRLWMTLAVVLAFFVLLVWSPIAALEAPLGIALFAAVIGIGAALVGRQAALEA